MSEAKKTTRKRLTRDDWIQAATQRLLAQGVEAVRIESLAESMSVSRGSFYWHFKNHAELLEAILIRWRETQTRGLMNRISKDRRLSAADQLAKLRTLPPRSKATKDASELELAVRAWARRDPVARHIVEGVDRERIDFTTSLLVEAGTEPDEAQYQAITAYAYSLGESLLRENMTDAQIDACRSRLIQMQAATFADKNAS